MFKIKSISQLLVLVTGLVCSPALMAQNSVTVIQQELNLL